MPEAGFPEGFELGFKRFGLAIPDGGMVAEEVAPAQISAELAAMGFPAAGVHQEVDRAPGKGRDDPGIEQGARSQSQQGAQPGGAALGSQWIGTVKLAVTGVLPCLIATVTL